MDLGSEVKNRAYMSVRPEVLALVGLDRRKVLDVGCSTGALGAAIKERQDAVVSGIEFNPKTAMVAQQSLDRVAVGNLDQWDEIASQLGDERYDCIICADVLEHTEHPWVSLPKLVERLTPGGYVVISLPNVGHWDTLWNVFFRHRWPQRDRGLHDVTHLRWFASRNVDELVDGAGLTVFKRVRVYRIIERPSNKNVIARYLALPGLRNLLTFQFLLVASPESRPVARRVAAWTGTSASPQSTRLNRPSSS